MDKVKKLFEAGNYNELGELFSDLFKTDLNGTINAMYKVLKENKDTEEYRNIISLIAKYNKEPKDHKDVRQMIIKEIRSNVLFAMLKSENFFIYFSVLKTHFEGLSKADKKEFVSSVNSNNWFLLSFNENDKENYRNLKKNSNTDDIKSIINGNFDEMSLSWFIYFLKEYMSFDIGLYEYFFNNQKTVLKLISSFIERLNSDPLCLKLLKILYSKTSKENKRIIISKLPDDYKGAFISDIIDNTFKLTNKYGSSKINELIREALNKYYSARFLKEYILAFKKIEKIYDKSTDLTEYQFLLNLVDSNNYSRFYDDLSLNLFEKIGKEKYKFCAEKPSFGYFMLNGDDTCVFKDIRGIVNTKKGDFDANIAIAIKNLKRFKSIFGVLLGIIEIEKISDIDISSFFPLEDNNERGFLEICKLLSKLSSTNELYCTVIEGLLDSNRSSSAVFEIIKNIPSKHKPYFIKKFISDDDEKIKCLDYVEDEVQVLDIVMSLNDKSKYKGSFNSDFYNNIVFSHNDLGMFSDITKLSPIRDLGTIPQSNYNDVKRVDYDTIKLFDEYFNVANNLDLSNNFEGFLEFNHIFFELIKKLNMLSKKDAYNYIISTHNSILSKLKGFDLSNYCVSDDLLMELDALFENSNKLSSLDNLTIIKYASTIINLYSGDSDFSDYNDALLKVLRLKGLLFYISDVNDILIKDITNNSFQRRFSD